MTLKAECHYPLLIQRGKNDGTLDTLGENIRPAVTLYEGGWSRFGHAEEKEGTGTRGMCR